MAYARKSRTRRATGRRTKAKTTYRGRTRRTTGRARVARRAPARARRAPARSRGTDRVTVEIIQRPMDYNPIAEAMAASRKEVPPRRARI